MYKLIITEKPSVALTIADALGVKDRKDGFIEGSGYLISWCVGHLAEFAAPEVYDEKYAKWNTTDLPIIPGNWRYVVTPAKKKQFLKLRELMSREDVSEVINACDAGREGELIFRNVFTLAGCKKPVMRLWISSMEDEAIRAGFEALRPGADYDGLYESALCRAKADWLVGMNATRLYSVLYHRTLNVGRVVSPTLAMLVQREAEISSFVSAPFYTVELAVDGGTAATERMDERHDADKLCADCDGMSAIVKSVERKEHSEKAPALYDLTTLQRDANRKFGYTAQQTLDYLQSLYEKKLCTYPRTDSRFLTDDMASGVSELVSIAERLCGLTAPKTINAAQVCNSKKVTDHHAIVPTLTAGKTDMNALPNGERSILQLVSLRLLEAVSDDYRYAETVVTMMCSDTVFTMKGRVILAAGWRQYGKRDKSTPVPDYEEGQIIPIQAATVKEGKTTPPKRYSEDTLLAEVENAGSKDMPEDAERRGIGTPATRAAILEKLVSAGFIRREKSKKSVRLVPEAKGRSLITALPEQLRSPLLTAEWEHKLKLIERGELSASAFLAEIQDMLWKLVTTAKPVAGAEVLFPSGRKVIGKCPRCSGDVTESKNGYFCERSDCRFALWRDNMFLTSKRVTLTTDMAKALLEHGQVMGHDLYSERTGKTYDAMIVLADDGQHMRYKLSFENA